MSIIKTRNHSYTVGRDIIEYACLQPDRDMNWSFTCICSYTMDWKENEPAVCITFAATDEYPEEWKWVCDKCGEDIPKIAENEMYDTSTISKPRQVTTGFYYCIDNVPVSKEVFKEELAKERIEL